MISVKEMVAKKHAQALFNLYFQDLKPTCIDSLVKLDHFFKENKRFITYLCIPTISASIKEQVLEQVFQTLSICATVQKVIAPLLQKRIELLQLVIAWFIELYQKKIGTVSFEVLTSHQLSSENQENIVSFLEQKLGLKVLANFFIDRKLICGVRAESKTFLFERSLVKKIRDAKTSFYQRIKP